MLTPDRFPNERKIHRGPIVSPFHEDERRTKKTEAVDKKPKAWSVRARRDVPNILRGDRFIPRRIDLDCDFALDMIVAQQTNENQRNEQLVRQQRRVQRRPDQQNSNNANKKTLELLEYVMPQNRRIYHFGVKTLQPRPIEPSDLARQIDALTITSKERYISSTPERILDAPDLVDDFYLNLIDWGKSSNMIAVALLNCVFLWDDNTGQVTKLLEVQSNQNIDEDDENANDENIHYISSVAWHSKASYLAIGTSYQQVLIYDVQQQACKRRLISDETLDDDDRIPSLAWNGNLIACGTRNTGDILVYDVRQKESIVKFRQHRQEVCGLKWCPNGRYLASGSNDNTVCVWDMHQWYSGGNVRSMSSNHLDGLASLLPPADGKPANTPTTPLWHFKEHRAAVKAMAWCPWEGSKVLATGGGHSDGFLRFWNNSNGSCQHSIQTESQVSSIVWSTDYKQIVTGQGHPNNFIHIWHYPSLEKCHTLRGHTARILSLIMGPKGNPIVSLSADETIRFWNCFPVDIQRKKKLEMTRTQSYPTKLNFNCR